MHLAGHAPPMLRTFKYVGRMTMDRETIERTIANLSEAVLKTLDRQDEIKETELFTAQGKDFQIHFIPYDDGRMTDVIVAEMNRRHEEGK